MRNFCFVLALLAAVPAAWSASKPHVISFGTPLSVNLFLGPSQDHTMDIKVRALYVDGKLKEFITDKEHDVTDRTFVVRRAYRINDSLPDDKSRTPKWLWQRGGWLLADRNTGHVSLLKLPDFDLFYSEVSWYRDYAAYCGVSENGEHLSAVVAEIGNRKALYRKDLGKPSTADAPDAQCDAPHWERPARVTFLPKDGSPLAVEVSGGRFADEPGDTSNEQ